MGFRVIQPWVNPRSEFYWFRRRVPKAYRHFDELIADIGAKNQKRGGLNGRFLPPDADAYAKFPASAPDYRVA
ncbi:hypothetical protein QA640_02515 [Bradyrhizobium sp. CB82]|uniref:hypothetical protein n=1 Tax=Bradyrhizobium sp. CB82 TaxID=3039159 RepID=UPI0024B177E0|nr:hypothetical protein [Bradyrhizobium sp. CB82]WFU45385.1 hypothetical protein QA640_02515 [Bradyrhizobium sp. CB82]